VADRTGIEWTEATWNPTTGCDRVSSGCENCYALALASRLKAMGSAKYANDGDPRTSGPGFGITTHENSLGIPFGWRSPRTVFVNSMSDLWHPDVPNDYIASVFAVMARSGRHTYQVLTKRPQRMAKLLSDQSFEKRVLDKAARIEDIRADRPSATGLPLNNVWLGTSIETDAYSWRADHLRSTPAAVRFLSLEPLLGPLPNLDLSNIDWVIVGGESGMGARPIKVEWVRSLRDRCDELNVAFFFKQWGGRTPKAHGRQLDGRTWDQMPADGQSIGEVASLASKNA
jgi:protein gp37